MKFNSVIAAATAAVVAITPVVALQATTTRYNDGRKGACGCGTGDTMFSWQPQIASGVYTAAGSPSFFDSGSSTWCGSGCGTCYSLTSTGNPACSDSTKCGTGGGAGNSIIVMITNLCPNEDPNKPWCPANGAANDYGYSYHFDIMVPNKDTDMPVGDNSVVDFEPVECPATALSDWSQCECYTGLE